MATFDVIKSEVKQRLGNRTDIDDRLPVWINDAYFEILMEPEYTFYELDRSYAFSTVAGQGTYDISSVTALWFILMLRDMTNEREIKKTSIKVLDRVASTQGQPIRYARFGQTIEFDPVPNDVFDIRIRYRYRANELVPGASPIIGREWDEVLVVLSTIKGYEALEQPEKAAAARQLLNPLIDARKDLEQLEDEDSDIGIKVRMKGKW